MKDLKLALVSAGVLEELGILNRTVAYKMAKAGQIPSYLIGTKGKAVRFRVDEVLTALRRPILTTGKDTPS